MNVPGFIYIFCFIYSTIIIPVHAQHENYLVYHDLINQAEEKFIKHEYRECFSQYDKAFSTVKYPFIKDYFIAAQCTFFIKDIGKSLQYLKMAFDNGFPWEALFSADMFNKADTTYLRKARVLYESRQILRTIDTSLRDTIALKAYDKEALKRNIFISKENLRDFEKVAVANNIYFRSFLSRGMFPNERMVGIRTESDDITFYFKYKLIPLDPPLPKSKYPKNGAASLGRIPGEYLLTNDYALVSFMHNPCAFHTCKEELWNAVINGYLHPKDYAVIEEYAVIIIDRIRPAFAKCPSDYNAGYNITNSVGTEPTPNDIAERNRKKRHIQSLIIDKEKRKLEDNKGFAFFSGHMRWR